MSKWEVVVTKEAERDLARLGQEIRKRVLQKIKWLEENFDLVTPLPLGGKWRGFFKLRVGDWRIIYEMEIANKQIVIHYIDLRDKIYKRI